MEFNSPWMEFDSSFPGRPVLPSPPSLSRVSRELCRADRELSRAENEGWRCDDWGVVSSEEVLGKEMMGGNLTSSKYRVILP
jgi:hypothetical protein